MASVRYIILSACQSEGLYAQAGWESEAAAWIEKQGSRPCAYVGYRRGQGVAGFDNVSVVFGGSDPRAALLRVRDSLERSLEFRSERQTEVGGFPALVMTARAKKRVYSVYGGARPTPPAPTVDYMYFEAQEANSTVALTSTLETAPDLEYSTDGVNWQEWEHTTAEGVHTFDTLTLTDVGDRVYLRGDNPNGLGTLPEGAEMPLYSHFEMTGKIAAGGNIMSMLDKDTEITEIPAYGLFILFGAISEENPNTSLTAAAEMPNVTAIGDGGCAYMYSGCTSLTAAAAMPNVTTIGEGGCVFMYQVCTSLTAAAAMPNVTTIGEGGCAYMYSGCTSLTAAAAMPNVTAIGDGGCVFMYQVCTSLTAAAAMPNVTTIGEGGCDHMYQGCTSLTAAAEMPNVTAIGDGGCAYMYSGCTGLTQAPSLPATVLAEGCYKRMFYGCTGLTQAPSLPATALADSCYSYMFDGCIGLTQSPSLPATALTDSCYSGMFDGCTFNMSDDGTTFNFQCDATLPQTVGDDTFSTPAELAAWMGNTNGFTNP